MKIFKFIIAISFFAILSLQAEESPYKFEGVLGSPSTTINNMNGYVGAFIPYNPIIVEIGAYEGAGTVILAGAYPYAKIFAFEPNPKAYSILEKNVSSLKNVIPVNLAINTSYGTAKLYIGLDEEDSQASLLLPSRSHSSENQEIDVPCVMLDDWCKQNGIKRIDFLRLDTGGFECQILKSSPETLKTALTIVTKTYFHKPKKSIINYFFLKRFLERNDFELLSHWYLEGQGGEALFIRKCMYDSIFR